MKPKFYLTTLLVLISQFLKAQNVIYDNMPLGWPKLTIYIKPLATEYKTSDSIKVQVTIINKMNYAQKIAYKKGNAELPLETWFLLKDSKGRDATLTANKNLWSNHMYSQKELENSNGMTTIQPFQSLSKVYYLKDVVDLNSRYDEVLTPDTYSLQVRYYEELSNKIFVKISK